MFSTILILLVILLLAYLLLWPVPIDPQGWNPPKALPYEGKYALRNSLGGAEKLWKAKMIGPEATAIKDGMLYTGLHNGDVVRAPIGGTDDGSGEPEVIVNTGGRPIGLKFDAQGNLIMCDMMKGLIQITPSGEMSVLSDSVNGRKYNVADDLAIAADGKIYFSDISNKYDITQANLAMMEDNPLGELICYDPATGSSSVVLDDMHLANGVCLSPDEDYVLVNETVGFRVSRLWLKGPKAGQRDMFLENLPGAPDNITYNGNGTYWIALAFPRYPQVDALASKPFRKKLMMRLPRFMATVPEFFLGLELPSYGLFVGTDLDGNITHFMDSHTGEVGLITSVLEHEGQLYLGSLVSDYVARVPVPDPV